MEGGWNLFLLLPEWAVFFVVASLALLEITVPSFVKKFSTGLNLSGTLLTGAALVAVGGNSGFAFQEMFQLDAFALFFKWIFLGSAGVTFLMRRNAAAREEGREFNLLLWSSLLGMFFLVSSHHFLLFFIALELLTLSLYLLAAYSQKSRASVEAGLKYLILGSLSSAFLLYGISLIYAAAGTLSFDGLWVWIRQGTGSSWLFLTGVLFVISALGFKVAAVPFHIWVPDVYEGAPTPVTAFLSVASKAAGFAALIRVLSGFLGPLESELQILFSIFAVLTLFYGNLGALVQKKMKRFLAYSSIGQAGFLLIGLVARDLYGVKAILYYLAAYAFTNLAVFLIVSVVEKSEGETLEDYRGLSRRSPFLAAVLFIGLLSLAGVPPLGGFFAKFLVLLAAGQSRVYWILFVGAVNVAISLFYYLNVVRIVYFEKPGSDSPIPFDRTTAVTLAVLAAGILLTGVWQAPFYCLASSAALSLF